MPLVWAATRASANIVPAVRSSTVRSSGARPEIRANASRAEISQASIALVYETVSIPSPRLAIAGRVAAEMFGDAAVGEQETMSPRACAEGVTGVLLVGGASRRFGSPKALAWCGEKTFADIAWERLAWCDERLACGKLLDGLPLRFPVRNDDSPVRAPL